MKLSQTLSVYLLSIALAMAAFHFQPFDYMMPPWETWFDYLGLFWSMALSCCLTLLSLVTLSAVIAGVFQRYNYKSGLISTFLLTFVSLLTYYISSQGGPEYTFQIIVPLIVAVITLLPFSLGHLIKTKINKKIELAGSANLASLGG